MKQTSRYILCASLMATLQLVMGNPAGAQQEDTYNESVLVKGSFRPHIEQAEKMTFPAEVTDTMTHIDHTFRYSISPSRLRSLYEPARIKAARIIGEPATKLYNNYFRLGLGNHWSPLADLYWSSTRDTKKTYGVRVNHRSSWGSIDNYGKNHFGLTSATAFGKYIVKDILQLSSDINYEHDHNLYYGFTDETLMSKLGMERDDLKLSDIRAKYNVLTWNVGVRNMEPDVYGLGYAANLRLSDLWASRGQNEFNLNLSGGIHYGFVPLRDMFGVAFLNVEWDGYSHSVKPDVGDKLPLGFSAPEIWDTIRGTRNIVKLNPYVDFMYRGLLIHAGFTAGWDGFTLDPETVFRFFPDVVVSKNLMDNALVLSVGATGGFSANSWDVIRKVNPYVAPGAEQRATRHYDFTAHARWTISKKLEANAEVGYSLLQDDLSFALDPRYSLGNVYRTMYVDNNRLVVGADIAFVNDEMLTLRAAGHYYHYDHVGTVDSLMAYRPDWDFLLSADVNYNDKWIFHLEGQLLGKMHGEIGEEELPMRYGVNAEVEYRHNRALSFFLKMDNLAFQRYYYWSHYPSHRGLFILGLTYTIPHK
ncbi:MAG: hypothetical protein IJ745_02740 [Bacteroidales bacterium]|nr:hypothetical protein [Bacteroidales bacterium]